MKATLPTVLAGMLALSLWLGRPPGAAARGVSPEYLRQLTPLLQDGDLIFIRISNPIFRRVAETTDSWETHVGILFSGTNGTWQVAESTFPFSRFSSLNRFINRSEHGRFCILRYKGGLTPEEKPRNQPYHEGTRHTRGNQNCFPLHSYRSGSTFGASTRRCKPTA